MRPCCWNCVFSVASCRWSCCCDWVLKLVVPIEYGWKGETTRGWKGVKRPCCLRLSVFQSQWSTEYHLQQHCVLGNSSQEHPFCLSAVSVWKLLYMDMSPLGLQALHAGENLLLVASQSYTHLSQFTIWKNENLLMTLENLLLSNTK